MDSARERYLTLSGWTNKDGAWSNFREPLIEYLFEEALDIQRNLDEAQDKKLKENGSLID